MISPYKEDYLHFFNVCPFDYKAFAVSGEVWDPVNRFKNTSLMAFVTPTDRLKSVLNRCVIEVFGDIFVLSRCFLDLSVGVGAFVIALSQISSLFSNNDAKHGLTSEMDMLTLEISLAFTSTLSET